MGNAPFIAGAVDADGAVSADSAVNVTKLLDILWFPIFVIFLFLFLVGSQSVPAENDDDGERRRWPRGPFVFVALAVAGWSLPLCGLGRGWLAVAVAVAGVLVGRGRLAVAWLIKKRESNLCNPMCAAPQEASLDFTCANATANTNTLAKAYIQVTASVTFIS